MSATDWNDLRYVLAVARSNSAAAAARALGVSHATVLRRIRAVEQSFSTVFFERLPSGYVATEAGRTLVRVAEQVEASVTDTRRLIDGRTAELSGTVRFTTTDSLFDSLVLPLLPDFRRKYPTIQVETVVTNNVLDLDKGDADVTLRPSLHPPKALVGCRLCRLDFAAYAASGYLDAQGDKPWIELDWLMPSGSPAQSPAGNWLLGIIPSQRAVLSADSFIALRSAAVAGLGATVLPCFLARESTQLRQVLAAPRTASTELWILTHVNLRQSGRIRAFMEHIATGIRACRELLECDGPSSSIDDDAVQQS